jgi:peptidoglycan/LPS O-acetylase OafA/YrhL
MGEASYSIYLSHQIVIGLIYKKAYSLFPQAGKGVLIGMGSMAVVLAVIIGILIHWYVEKRLLTLMNKWMFPERKHPLVPKIGQVNG